MFEFSVDRETFRETYFEKTPLHIPRCFDHGPYSWRILDEALFHADPSADFLKLIKNGRIEQEVFTEQYVDIGVPRRRIRKDFLYSKLKEGASVVLNRLDLFSSLVSAVCLEVGQFVGAQASANGYASFGGEPATNVHWDTHDVFIVQLRGKKHWQLFEPTHPLPISSQVSNERRDEVPSTPWMDLQIEAGDVLYVPRGWWHRVSPIHGQETFHLTVAVTTPLLLDYVIWACANKFPDHLAVRRSLIGQASDVAHVAEACELISNLLRHPATLQSFYDRARARERVVSPFNIEALISDPQQPLEDLAELQVNSRYGAAGQKGRFNGQAQAVTPEWRRVLEAVLLGPGRRIADLRVALPDLGADRLDELVRELVCADLLSLRRPDTPTPSPLAAPAPAPVAS